MTSRFAMALVATLALASGRAYASGGSGVAHDDTTYSDTASTWGGTVAFGAASHPTYDDTSYSAAHTTIRKPLLPAGSVAFVSADDTVYPTADAPRAPAGAPQASDRGEQRVACGCTHACAHG